MKRLFLLLFVLISQTSFGEKVRGYYILFSNDTIITTFDIKMNAGTSNDSIPDLIRLRKWLVLFESKKILGPRIVKEYLFIYNDIRYRMVSKKKNFHTRCFFRLTEGNNSKLKLLIYYKTGESYGPYDDKGFFVGGGAVDPVEEKVYLQKYDEPLYKPDPKYFKEDVLFLIKDCPRMVDRFKDDDEFLEHLEKLVFEYNRVCGK